MSIPVPDRTLLQAVDILTLAHDTMVERQGAYLFTRQDPALIPALRQAIHSNIGTGSGGGTTPHHERGVIDPEASELYRAVEKRIRNWATRAGYRPTQRWPEPENLLRTWYATHPARFDERAYLSTLNGWIRQIEEKLIDAPRRWTLNEACPACGHRWAETPDGLQVDAIQVVERDPIDHSEYTCRHCNARWEGVNGARALALAIDLAKAHKATA